MRRYQFRLEPVLKLRKLKEENCRHELGRLISELDRIENQLDYDKLQISNYYLLQEETLKKGMKGGQLQVFPMMVEAKTKNIELLHRDKANQEKLIEEKKRELAVLQGELKVIENLKEKDYTDYRKALNKEIDQKVEEQTQNWLNHQKKGIV